MNTHTPQPSPQNKPTENARAAPIQAGQWDSTDQAGILASDATDAASAAQPPSVLSLMRATRRWLLASPQKVPHYTNGQQRRGNLDSPEDQAQFATYDDAKAALAKYATGWTLGFALGPDGTGKYWQGIDFDDIEKNCLSEFANTVLGYVEISPGREGCHAIGYGRHFNALGANGTGIEAYADRRFFTVTENLIRDGQSTCLASLVEQELMPRHSTKNSRDGSNTVEIIRVDPKTVTELRSALSHLRSDDYHLWIKMGMALCELGDIGRGLWLDWSATSAKYKPKDAHKWDSFKPKEIGYQAVFAEAQRQDWVNPASNAAKLPEPEGLTEQNSEFQSRKPRDILRKIAPAPYDFEDVPPPISAFAYCHSQATGYDQSGIIVACVTAAASVIDDRFMLTVRPESNWHVSARLWSFLCGGSSAGKSPVIKAATAPIKNIHESLIKKWNSRQAAKKKNGKNPDDETDDPIPAVYTSDSTVAAISDRLQGNPRGLLVLTEEFSSWIGNIDSGSRGDAAKNRGDWLQLRDGGARQIDRIMRGPVYVPNWGASVLAACTPGSLVFQMKNVPEDGLIQRFIPCIMSAQNIDGPYVDARQAIATWRNLIEWGFSITERSSDFHIALSAAARQLFDAEEKSIRQLVINTEDLSPSYASHLGKHPGMLAEIALVFHIFGEDAGPNKVLGNEVGEVAMRYAIRFMRKVRRHAYALYSSILSTSPAYELARTLARSIAAADDPILIIGRDWMTQHCQAFKKADDQLRRQAVQILEDADWLKARLDARSYGSWPSRYTVNKNVFQLFAREGEQWRARRAAVKDAITEIE